jgi:hypothetical protein
MTALPDTTRLLLAVARALHTTGYRRTQPALPGQPADRCWKAGSGRTIEFQPAPADLPEQIKLIVRHGTNELTWSGITDPRDAVTVLAMLGIVGTCRQCDLPVEADAVECEACAVTTDLIAYDAAVDYADNSADYGRHSAHEAA